MELCCSVEQMDLHVDAKATIGMVVRKKARQRETHPGVRSLDSGRCSPGQVGDQEGPHEVEPCRPHDKAPRASGKTKAHNQHGHENGAGRGGVGQSMMMRARKWHRLDPLDHQLSPALVFYAKLNQGSGATCAARLPWGNAAPKMLRGKSWLHLLDPQLNQALVSRKRTRGTVLRAQRGTPGAMLPQSFTVGSKRNGKRMKRSMAH